MPQFQAVEDTSATQPDQPASEDQYPDIAIANNFDSPFSGPPSFQKQLFDLCLLFSKKKQIKKIPHTTQHRKNPEKTNNNGYGSPIVNRVK